MFVGDVMKDEMWGGEVKLFLFFFSKLIREGYLVGV